MLISALKEVSVGLSVNVCLGVAKAEKVSQFLSLVVSVTNNAFDYALGSRSFSFLQCELANFNEEVVNCSVICNFLNVLNKVDF